MNRLLKSRMVFVGATHKKIAGEMGINERVFRNKLNHTKVNGYTAHFTDAQKKWLGKRFGINPDAIK